MHIHFEAPYRQGNLTRDQINCDKAPSQARITDEWVLGEINTYFKFIIDFKTKFKTGLSSVLKIYLVCWLLKNAKTCLPVW